MDSIFKKRVAVFFVFFFECILWYFAGIFAAARDVYACLFVVFWVAVVCVVIIKRSDEKAINGVLSAVMIYSLFMFFVLMNSMVPYYKMDSSMPVANIFFFKRDAGVVFGTGGVFGAFADCIYLIVMSKFFRAQQ